MAKAALTAAGEQLLLDAEADAITVAFTRSYYYRRVHHQTTYCGIPIVKAPTDLWVLQEIIWETRPDVIIETGTFLGGSALFMVHCLTNAGITSGRVITIDPDLHQYTDGPTRPRHSRIVYLHGSSLDMEIQKQVWRECPSVMMGAAAPRVMVVLDSQHERAHVLAELHAYSPMITPGCYLVIEDTCINGHPVEADLGAETDSERTELKAIVADGGPYEAVEEFLALQSTHRWEQDRSREKFLLTMNPGGWLKRLENPR